MSNDWTIASVIIAVAVVTTIWIMVEDIRTRAPKLSARPDPKTLAAESLTTSATAEFLLAEVRSQLERRTAAGEKIDSKIGQFLTIVGGGAGLLAVATLNGRSTPIAHPPALVVAGGVTLLMVLTLCVVSAVPRNRSASDLRDIADYNTITFLSDDNNKARLAHEFIARYANLSNGVRLSTKKKRWYYVAASSLFVLALAAVLASFVT